jgi:hypothetical protein
MWTLAETGSGGISNDKEDVWILEFSLNKKLLQMVITTNRTDIKSLLIL